MWHACVDHTSRPLVLLLRHRSPSLGIWEIDCICIHVCGPNSDHLVTELRHSISQFSEEMTGKMGTGPGPPNGSRGNWGPFRRTGTRTPRARHVPAHIFVLCCLGVVVGALQSSVAGFEHQRPLVISVDLDTDDSPHSNSNPKGTDPVWSPQESSGAATPFEFRNIGDPLVERERYNQAAQERLRQLDVSMRQLHSAQRTVTEQEQTFRKARVRKLRARRDREILWGKVAAGSAATGFAAAENAELRDAEAAAKAARIRATRGAKRSAGVDDEFDFTGASPSPARSLPSDGSDSSGDSREPAALALAELQRDVSTAGKSESGSGENLEAEEVAAEKEKEKVDLAQIIRGEAEAGSTRTQKRKATESSLLELGEAAAIAEAFQSASGGLSLSGSSARARVERQINLRASYGLQRNPDNFGLARYVPPLVLDATGMSPQQAQSLLEDTRLSDSDGGATGMQHDPGRTSGVRFLTGFDKGRDEGMYEGFIAGVLENARRMLLPMIGGGGRFLDMRAGFPGERNPGRVSGSVGRGRSKERGKKKRSRRLTKLQLLPADLLGAGATPATGGMAASLLEMRRRGLHSGQRHHAQAQETAARAKAAIAASQTLNAHMLESTLLGKREPCPFYQASANDYFNELKMSVTGKTRADR